MNDEATYRFGNIQNAREIRTKTIAPPVKRVYGLDATTKRRKRNQERQTAVRSHSHVAHGFLRTSFLPKLQETETLQACRDNANMERDFYISLSQLTEHYGIAPKPLQDFGYPYNIALALKDIEEQLSRKVQDFEVIRLIQDTKKTYFISEERYNTGANLYYIPVVPLFRWLKNPHRKQTAQLLLSVCSYLYHIADIPYYRQQSSYLFWIYDMHKDWFDEDDYGEDTQSYSSEFTKAEWIGDRMEQKIFNQDNLKYFKNRLNSFKIKDNVDNDCFEVAQKAYTLYQQYPNETVFRNARPNGQANEADMENIISMEKYVSFCADATGWLMDNLVESVNNELQEYGQMEEPIISKQFNGFDIAFNTLEFENRLFPMMSKLVYLLNNF